MFYKHEAFPDQPPDDATVWRYMDLARFISLIDSRDLYFTQAALMKDKWEGSYGAKATDEDGYIEWVRGHPLSSSMYLNCWHLSEYESAAMWEIYQRDNRGVAVKTTWGELKSSLRDARPITGGRVHYVDYGELEMSNTNALAPFMYKRLSFEHEREVRLGYWSSAPVKIDPSAGLKEELGYVPRDSGTGVRVAVDLDRAVKEVFLAPDAESWILPVVSQLARKYGLAAPVTQSNLYAGPM